MILIDSSYFIALYNKLDSQHLKACGMQELLLNKSVLYLEDVLKETQSVLMYKMSGEEGFAWIDAVYENESDLDRQYNLSSTEYFEVLNYWRSLSDVKLSFVDAEILYLAQKHNFKVLSFDEELLKFLPKDLILV